jgi:hypothetical protein
MNETELRLALRRAALRQDWTGAERIGRRLGWRLLTRGLRRGLARLALPRHLARLRLR